MSAKRRRQKIFIDSKGSIFDTLTEMEQDLQSAISYAGGTTLQAIRKVDYVLVKTLSSMAIASLINIITLKDTGSKPVSF